MDFSLVDEHVGVAAEDRDDVAGERPRAVDAARVRRDHSRDALLTDFGKATLDDRYLLPGESYQDLFARVASAFGDDAAHSQRLYDYISRLWFMPATPVLSNGGTTRGLPISCFLNGGLIGSFALTGCIASTAIDIVTLPVRAAGAAVDAVTTSQSEADQKRGRELRKREEREGREARKAARKRAREDR